MQVFVLGAGLMGSQIACEYALGGHGVVVAARDREKVRAKVDLAFSVAAHYRLAALDVIEDARQKIVIGQLGDPPTRAVDLVVESITEDLSVKVGLLEPLAREHPDATIATNTSSLSITTLGDAIGAPTRTIGTHYWNPPLLMPLVEVVRGEQVDDGRIETIVDALSGIGKEPVVVERDVPGFIWNRLQFALLREALALVETGVASASTIDLVVRDGLARRWCHTGPFQTAALGGAETFAAVAANLFPVLSDAQDAAGLIAVTDSVRSELAGLAERRDTALAAQVQPL